MIVQPFKPEDLQELALQHAQAFMMAEIARPEYGESLAAAGPAYTARTNAGAVVGCLGLIHQWPGRALAWALLAGDAGQCMAGLHRGVLRFLRDCGYRRIETAVDCAFPAGQRWASLLGFRAEGRMTAYDPDGRDAYLYARVR